MNELFIHYLDKVKKNLPKKYIGIKDFLIKMADVLNNNNNHRIFVIFKIIINMRSQKLNEITLQLLLKMISLNYIDGSNEDASSEFYLEEYSELFEDQQKNIKVIDQLIKSVIQCLVEKEDQVILAMKVLVGFTMNARCNVQKNNLIRIVKSLIYVYTQSKSQIIDRFARTSLLQIINVVFQSIEQIQSNNLLINPTIKQCKYMLLQMVDDVVLHLDRNTKNIKQIPNDPRFAKLFQSESQNELGIQSGRFGWCTICRQSAQYYCKDHRIPVCTYKCKKVFGEFQEQSQKQYDSIQQYFNQSLENAIYLFESLVKLLENKLIKNQLLILELIYHILNEPDKILLESQLFQKCIKDLLISQLLKYCLEQDKSFFTVSFQIFLQLVFQLRKILKTEISIFVDQIFLQIVTSANSSYQHKYIALEVLMKIMSKPKFALEFYINFDCAIQHVSLISRITNTLDTIVQQLYLKQDFQVLITPMQEFNLRILAINTLCYMIIGSSKTFDNLLQQMQNTSDQTQTETIPESDEVEKQRLMKLEAQKGIQLFNQNPNKGMKQLISTNILSDNPHEIALFLKNTHGITKDAIGQFFGGDLQLNQKVLSEFTDILNMKNMSVEDGLRFYLSQFTLPGESQQVDRIVQKFSHKFFADNSQGIFKNSDSIYTFSYLLIMLQTDLHNPRVEEKMKISEFAKLAKGINDNTDLPQEYLQEIYYNVQKTPLALHENKLFQDTFTQSLAKRRDLFVKETQMMLKKGNELIKKGEGNQSIYLKVDSPYHIKPMLETIGQKCFNSFITCYSWDNFDQHPTLSLCVEAIMAFLKMQSYFSLSMDSYILTTVNLAVIGRTYKNNLLIKELLNLLPTIGNGLRQASWKPLLEMISTLDLLKQNQETDIDDDSLDKVFVYSKKFDAESLLEFIQALCFVSRQELFSRDNPRTFSLQKLVEVSDYNMDRIQLVWTQIWSRVRDHISEVGIKAKHQIACFAVDSLKQLSVKFLQKEELYNFQFQREFLRPFETIFTSLPPDQIKEYILACMLYIVLNYKSSIKSGWRVIFDLINYGLQEESDTISRQAYEILKQLMDNDLDLISDVIVDLVSPLVNLGKSKQEDLALASVDFVKKSLKYLSAQESLQPNKQWENDVSPLNQEPQIILPQLETYWVPLLGMLSTLAGDQRAKIQEYSLDTLFDLLQQYGYAFSRDFWRIVFQVVLRPLFDEIQFSFQLRVNSAKQESPTRENHWFKNSCQKGFNHITNLFQKYFNKLRDLLPDFLKLFENCIQNQNEMLAKFSLSAVKSTVMKLGQKFSPQNWEVMIEFFQRMLKLTTPFKLLSKSEEGEVRQRKKSTSIKVNTEESYTQCVSQLLLIQITKDIVESYSSQLNFEGYQDLKKLYEAIQQSFEFAQKFNGQIELRNQLWKNGFMGEMKQLPGLLRQEREAQACILLIKYQQYVKSEDQKILEEYKNLLRESLQQFIQKHKELQENIEELQRQIKYNQNELIQRNDEISKLKEIEIDREATNVRTLLDQTILPKLLQIVEHLDRQFFDLLLQASSYTVAYSFTQITCLECRSCERCLTIGKDSLDNQIKGLLKQLYLQKK